MLAAIYSGLLFTMVFYIFYVNFTAYCLFFLLVVYILLSIFLLQLGLEFLALFILMVYVGGLMLLILFVFFLFNADSSLYVKNNFSLPRFFFFFFILYYLLYPVLSHFSVRNYIIGDLVASSPLWKKNLILLYACFQGVVYGFDWDYVFYLGPILYTVYFIPLLNCFLIFFVCLFGIAASSNKNAYFLKPILLVSLHPNKITVLDFFLLSEFVWFNNWWSVGMTMIILAVALVLSGDSQNFIKIIIFLEVIFAAMVYMLAISSFFFYDLTGVIFILILLGLYAAETAIGLLIFSSTSKEYIQFKKKNE